MEYHHDEWEVDVTIAALAKGSDDPPGLSFNAISQKAMSANKAAKMPRSYWDWQAMLKSSETGFFPLHAGDEPHLRPARGFADDSRRRIGKRISPP